MTAVPCQNRAGRDRAGVSKEACEQAAWAVDADGRAFRGAGAMNVALTTALGTRLPLWIYRLPLVRWLQDAGYEFVARIRARLPGVEPHCMRFPEDCD